MEKRFNSIEEVKAFITAEDTKNFGGIAFVDEQTGNTTDLSLNEFVDKVGLDKAAEFIFKAQDKMVKTTFDKDEVSKLIDCFVKDPNSLTDEEKLKAAAILGILKNGPIGQLTKTRNEIFDIVTKILVLDNSLISEDITGVLSLLLTYLENMLITSTNLSSSMNNPIARQEIIKEATSKITIADDVDDATLMLGFIYTIGNRFIKKNGGLSVPVNYDALIDKLHLCREYIYDCQGCEEENKDCLNCSKRTIGKNDFDSVSKKELHSFIDNVSEQLMKDNNIPSVTKEELPDGLKSETTQAPVSSVNSGVIDIRDRLKRN